MKAYLKYVCGLFFSTLVLISCTQKTEAPKTATPAATPPPVEERSKSVELASEATRKKVAEMAGTAATLNGMARVGVLYFLDRPAHHEAVVQWFEQHGGRISFDDDTFGYLDAEIPWARLSELIASRGTLGLDAASVMKIEIDGVAAANPSATGTRPKPMVPPKQNTAFTGPGHSAGYGANLEGFRARAASRLKIPAASLNGEGVTAAIFDQGIDVSRTDVFANRIDDFILGESDLWRSAGAPIGEYLKWTKEISVPSGLEDIKDLPSLRFAFFNENEIGADANGSGAMADWFAVAVYEKGTQLEARVRVAPTLPFGEPFLDLSVAKKQGRPQWINLHTGNRYDRGGINPSPSAAGIKLRKNEATGQLEVALVGTMAMADHGIANLHMVGGDYQTRSGTVSYRGVAPGISFLGVQTWSLNGRGYGETWIPLARTIVGSVKAGADILDIDTYTPGTRYGYGLLSELLCRITARTDVVPVIAAHNFGPAPHSVQSLAQSPCAIGVGASHSLVYLRGRGMGTIRPELLSAGDEAVQTAIYSGRGFGLNGLYKPDIISPAYGYTAYGDHFEAFNGTSGATPATAGMIALLKQAAKLINVPLNLDQIRFLLQAGSKAPGAMRDGWGYVDLAKTWETFEKFTDFASQTTFLSPLRLTGQQFLHFDGKPSKRIIPISIKRERLVREDDAPVDMEFDVAYEGQMTSPDKQIAWLKIGNETGSPKEKVDLTLPMAGEETSLRLYLSLTEKEWAELPVGEHIAVVKGVRKNLKGSRAVDFIQPVSFTKAGDIDENDYHIKPLFAEDYEMIPVATSPGDVLLVNGHSECRGKKLPGDANGNADEPLWFVTDNDPFYAHASTILNTYRPTALGSHTLRIVAMKNVTRLIVYRQSSLRCDGPVAGTISVRRISMETKSVSTSTVEHEGNLYLGRVDEITVAAGSLLRNEIPKNSAPQWAAQYDPSNAVLVARTRTNVARAFPVIPGMRVLRIVPDTEEEFQAVLVERDPKGNAIRQATTQDGYSAGLSGLARIELSYPAEGNTLVYHPASTEKPVTIEIEFTFVPEISALMKPIPERIESVPLSTRIRVEWMVKLHSQLPKEFEQYPLGAFEYEVQYPVRLVESPKDASRSVTGVHLYLRDILLQLAVPFRATH